MISNIEIKFYFLYDFIKFIYFSLKKKFYKNDNPKNADFII